MKFIKYLFGFGKSNSEFSFHCFNIAISYVHSVFVKYIKYLFDFGKIIENFHCIVSIACRLCMYVYKIHYTMKYIRAHSTLDIVSNSKVKI